MQKDLKTALKDLYPKIKPKDILDHYNVRYEVKGDELNMPCIFHEKLRGKKDNHPSLNVNMRKKVFNCLSCPAKGNMYSLVQQLEITYGGKESCSFMDAVKVICEISNVRFEKLFKVDKDAYSDDMDIEDIEMSDEKYYQEVFSDSVLKKFYFRTHNYFLNRGYKPETLKTFEMGFGTKGKDKDRCIFPIRNVTGGLVGWTGRTVKNDPVKWLHQPYDRFYSSLNLFGIDKAVQHIIDENSVYIVESPGNAMRLWELGIKNVVAIFGMQLSQYQIDILSQYCDTFYLLFDNDQGGYDGIDIAVNLLYDTNINVFIGQYDFGHDENGYAYDIGDLSYKIDASLLDTIKYIDMYEYMEKNGGIIKMVRTEDEITETVPIETENGTVLLVPKLDKKDTTPQITPDVFSLLQRIDNLYKIQKIALNTI